MKQARVFISPLMDGNLGAFHRMKPALYRLKNADAHATFAHNFDISMDPKPETIRSLVRVLNFVSNNPSILNNVTVAGSLERSLNSAAFKITNRTLDKNRATIFYPRILGGRILSFLENYFRNHPSSCSLRSKLSNPQQLPSFNNELELCSNRFGPFYHSEVVESTIDPNIKKFDDCMTKYIIFYRFGILNDLVRRSFITYPPNLTYFNDELRVIKLMFSKTAMSSRASQKLMRGALNRALYGCEDFEKVKETVARLCEDPTRVSIDLKLISNAIEEYFENYGYSIPRSFTPDPQHFTIHTSINKPLSNCPTQGQHQMR